MLAQGGGDGGGADAEVRRLGELADLGAVELDRALALGLGIAVAAGRLARGRLRQREPAARGNGRGAHFDGARGVGRSLAVLPVVRRALCECGGRGGATQRQRRHGIPQSHRTSWVGESRSWV